MTAEEHVRLFWERKEGAVSERWLVTVELTSQENAEMVSGAVRGMLREDVPVEMRANRRDGLAHLFRDGSEVADHIRNVHDYQVPAQRIGAGTYLADDDVLLRLHYELHRPADAMSANPLSGQGKGDVDG